MSSTCQGRAPRPASRSATSAGQRRQSSPCGGSHITRRTKSGVSRFSTGRSCSLGERLEAGRGPWRAGRPPPGPGRPRRAAAAVRRTVRPRGAARPRASCGPSRSASTHWSRVALGARGRGSPWWPAATALSRGIALAASTIAASGMIRPGVTSRRCGDLVAGLPTARVRRPGRAGRGPGACPRYGATGPAAGRRARRATRCSNSWRAHSALPVSSSSRPSTSRSSTSTSTSRAAYSSHGSGQRPRRPVDGRVLLAQAAAHDGLDQGGQADPRVAEQPAGELGVEQRGRAQPDLGAGRQVLAGGVQDPLGVAERLAAASLEVVERRSGRPAPCRSPRGAAGRGRRAAE